MDEEVKNRLKFGTEGAAWFGLYTGSSKGKK